MKKWSKEEEEFLKDNYKVLSLEDICKHLNRSENSVQWRASKLGLTDKKNNSWTDNEVNLIMNPNLSDSQLSELTGRSISAIRKRRKILSDQNKIKSISQLDKYIEVSNIDRNIPILNIYSKSSQYLAHLMALKPGESFEYPESEHQLLRNQITVLKDKKFVTKKWGEKSRRVWLSSEKKINKFRIDWDFVENNLSTISIKDFAEMFDSPEGSFRSQANKRGYKSIKGYLVKK